MAIASKYWQFVGFDAAGRRRVEVLDTVKTFVETWAIKLEQSQSNFIDSDAYLQAQLWHKTQSQSTQSLESEKALLSLRCCVSHLIEQSCFQLAQQFGEHYHFRAQDLLPLVLDVNSRVAFAPQGGYESLTNRILSKFNPEQGNLATWTIRLVRNDRRINTFLLEHGVYLISDWAILNDTKPPQVERILLDFLQLTPYEAKAASQLLRCYHTVYRGDRLLAEKKGRCYEPNSEQLHRIVEQLKTLTSIPELRSEDSDEAVVLSRLQGLAGQLRQYRIMRRGGTPKRESLDAIDPRTGAAPQWATAQPEDDDEQDQFLIKYRSQLSASLDNAIEIVLERRYQSLKKKRQPQIDSWLQGLYLFHCVNESMGDIATKIGLKAQYQVSRLLQLKAMRTDIRQEMLTLLESRVLESAQGVISSEQLQNIETKLEGILAEQVDELLNQATKEASSARACPTQSLYAQRLCHCLSRRLSS